MVLEHLCEGGRRCYIRYHGHEHKHPDDHADDCASTKRCVVVVSVRGGSVMGSQSSGIGRFKYLLCECIYVVCLCKWLTHMNVCG